MEKLLGVEWRKTLMRASLFLLALLAVGRTSSGQATNAQTPPALSPLAMYEQATKPIEIVHRSFANWSDSETASLAVAIKKGADACAAREPASFAGDQLIAFARLCSLGMNWPAVNTGATQYIESKDAEKPQLALAYGMKLEAVLQSHSVPEIMATAKAMLAAVPYDATVDAASNEALDYLQLAYTGDALALHAVRLPILLDALAHDKPAVPVHTLYGDVLAKAALEQYAVQPEAALATKAALDQVMMDSAARLPQDEVLLAQALELQYAMLGQPLPKLKLQISLLDPRSKPAIDAAAAASTALLVFPAWCAQCVRMTARDLPAAVTTLKHGAVQVYALLAQPLPAPEELAPVAKPGTTPTAARLLLQTPTIVVPVETLETLRTSDYPWLVVVDASGVVRFQGVAPESALKTGEFVDRVTDHVAGHWPSKFVPVAVEP